MNLDKVRNFFKNFFKDRQYIICIFAILMCISVIYISIVTNHKKYVSDLTQFLCKNDINSFNKAVKSDQNITPSDLTSIYDKYIQKNYNDFKNKKIDENTYINNLKKIRDLKSMSKIELVTYLNKSNKYIQSKSNYSKAVILMNKKDYKGAFNLLSSITDLSDDYNKAKSKILDCSNIINIDTTKNINNLCSQNKYNDAEKLLDDNKNYLEDNDYNNLLSTLSKNKESYFKSLPDYNPDNTPIKGFPAASSVTEENINKMNVPSETKYLIYVNISKQRTYIFCGRQNSWNKYKEFSCSTGIADSATPTGFFKIGMKGTWFFSKKYGQGGKYWTSFKGTNYLFHSVPYDSSATKIVDDTLGAAASHGCVRLATDDSKFIHDVIPSGTSVVIN